MTHSPGYWLITGPHDPHTITVSTPTCDGTEGEPVAVHLVAEYADKPNARLSLGPDRARNIGGLLMRAADTIDPPDADNEMLNTIVSSTHTAAEGGAL